MEHKKQRIIQIVAISLTAVVIAVAVGLVFMFTKKEETPLNGYSREDTIQDITVYQTLYGENTETAATDAANAMNELSQLIGFQMAAPLLPSIGQARILLQPLILRNIRGHLNAMQLKPILRYLHPQMIRKSFRTKTER